MRADPALPVDYPMKRSALIYLVLISIAVVVIAWFLHLGSALPKSPSPGMAKETADHASAVATMWKGLAGNLSDPVSRLLLQLLIIIAASRLAGWIFTRIGQPSVVGEMAAGILLGPSLFGLLAPETFKFVFPATSLVTLKLLSQIGVCLFMFVVGMELNLKHVRNRAETAVVVSHASIVVPYLLGVLLAYFLFRQFAGPGTTFTAFALFMGISMSITAFPVLARILQERGLSKTFLGSTAITCAAVDDVTAWSVLAFVVAIAQASNAAASALNLVFVLAFVALMIWGVRKWIPLWIGADRLEQKEPSKGVLATVICIVVAAALTTEVIGIHALFGAFLAGAIMPETNDFRQKLGVRIENFSSVLLLPLFFAFTGLRTQIGLLSDVNSWLICLAIIVVATVGKLGGSAIAARLTGMNWSESLQLGALMNTRGLMELIALNIGYDLGILSPRIFAMLVIMALATTTMTGPLLTLFGRMRTVPRDAAVPALS